MTNGKLLFITMLTLAVFLLSAGKDGATACHDGDVVTVDGTVARIKELPNHGGSWIFLESPALDCGTIFVTVAHEPCQLGDKIHVEKGELEQDNDGNGHPMPYRWMIHDVNNNADDEIVTCQQDASAPEK